MSARTALQLSSVKCLRLCSAALWRFFFGPRPEGLLNLAEEIRPFGRYHVEFPARLFLVRGDQSPGAETTGSARESAAQRGGRPTNDANLTNPHGRKRPPRHALPR